MLNIAVLVSGGGTNLQALLDSEARGENPNGKITLVVASKPGVYALERAAKAGVESCVVRRKDYDNSEDFDAALLAPTKIYVKPVLKVLEEVDVKGISHITGGGFYENIPRSLKKGCCARIKKEDVRIPALFHLMQETGHISEHDMFNTFNMGVGMVLTVPAAQADKALEILHANGEPEAYRLGVIAEGEGVELC